MKKGPKGLIKITAWVWPSCILVIHANQTVKLSETCNYVYELSLLSYILKYSVWLHTSRYF